MTAPQSPPPSPSPLLHELPEAADTDPSLLCKYPSKKCWSRRAVKRNGEMHNLCDLHREKANKNQRRLELKRKTRAATKPAPSALFPHSEQPPLRAPRSRQRKRSGAPRGVLSTHLAMREEARAQQLASLLELRRNASRCAAAALLPSSTAYETTYSPGFYSGEQPLSLRISTTRAEEEIERALFSSSSNQHSAADELALLCGALDAVPPTKASAGLATTSPVDVGEGWDALDAAVCWDLPTELADSSDIMAVARV